MPATSSTAYTGSRSLPRSTRARVDLGKEREPVYAVDDVAGMLFLRTAPGTLVGYRL